MAMKFGQLIEYNIRNIFLEKSYTRCCVTLVPDPFLKYQNWAYPWINSLKFYTAWGLAKLGAMKIYWN